VVLVSTILDGKRDLVLLIFVEHVTDVEILVVDP